MIFSICELSSFSIMLSCSGELYFSNMIPSINSSGSSSPTELIIDFKFSPVFSSADIKIYLSGSDFIFSIRSFLSSFDLSGK